MMLDGQFSRNNIILLLRSDMTRIYLYLLFLTQELLRICFQLAGARE